MSEEAHGEHEAKLAQALSELVHQIDINDYRDSLGHPAKTNLSFLKAQAIVDAFCVSHAEICATLNSHGDDLTAAARRLVGLGRGAARLADDQSEAPPRPAAAKSSAP